MAHRPSLMDRVLFVAARQHAEHVYKQFIEATARATVVQDRVLLDKIRRNTDSVFGHDYHFDSIASAADFTRQVPILNYEDYQPYIKRVQAGDLGALFGRGQRVHMFAMSSGTTAEPKYIPVTEEFLNEYRRGWNAFGIKALLDHPDAFLRGIVQITSRMDESHTSAGIPCGAITGLMAATQKLLVRKYYLSPRCLAEIDDATAKYYTIMRLAVPADAAFLITANPATQLKLARTADEHRKLLIRDIHDGTLRADLPIPASVHQQLRGRLKPDRNAARRLEAIVGEHGRLLPKHYWNLSFLANWTGGTMGLYLNDFPQYFGDTPVRDIGLLASEGRISIPIDDATPAGILDVTSHFFEFVPRDRIEEASPVALRSHEVEVGQEYFILLTTSSGLYRYHLGDLVRVVGFEGQAPVIEFLNKGDHICSLSGEKLTEHQVILAMNKVAQNLGTQTANFVLTPRWGNPPYYMLHIESDGSDSEHVSCSDLAAALDGHLQAINIEYAGKRQTARLGPVSANLLPAEFLADLDRTEAARFRPSNEQYKHRYLYTRPGDDADFPVAREIPGT